jgi:hypothetical protein
MSVRKSAIHLTTEERENFIYALLTMKMTIANPGEPDPAKRISIYDRFVAQHLYVQAMRHLGTGPRDEAHGGAAFGPWHREFLRRFELALQAAATTPPGAPHPGVPVMLPYWDWTDHAGTDGVLFQDSFMGPNGGGAALGGGGGDVLTGYFAFDPPGVGANTFVAPPGVLPPGWTGWRLRADLGKAPGTTLRRFISSLSGLATQMDVLITLGQLDYGSFETQLEAGTHMHNWTHGWVGGFAGQGHMARRDASPNDAIFFLHHCQVDRLWAMWQANGHGDASSAAVASFYPGAGQTFGHNLGDPMWPWVGAAAGDWTSDNALPDIVLDDFSGEPGLHPGDELDHRALGNSYDTEPVVGIALDQTGSMTGLTPDPMTGMGNVSKWDAAKQGVSALLHDCESAFAAAEAYVTGGVETFRSLAVNTFTPIFGGSGYGTIRSGGAVSQAVFDANILAQSPGGGTPLAGALTDTEGRLVFPPAVVLPGGGANYPGTEPADDTRYLMILTDGIETAPPPLSSLGTPQFPNTIVFAMGFGVGSGWNGVDYATIATLVAKGKPAPAGVSQTFHGDSAGEIDKFFGQSIAAVIRYAPSVDPIYELFPGEHADTPFYATDADESFMITGQGFDFSDPNWAYCLLTPTGDTCSCDGECEGDPGHGHHDHHAIAAAPPTISRHLHGQVLVTTNKANGRMTVFLNRNGAPSEEWVGQWLFRAMYRMDGPTMVMFMPSGWDLLLPQGAPPVKGPAYPRAFLPPSRRTAVRLQPPVAGQSLLAGTQGVSVPPVDPCSVAVNVYARSTIRTRLIPTVKAPFAGQDIEIALEVDDAVPAEFDNLSLLGRLVAPAHSLGNAFADLRTTPAASRRKYLAPDNPAAPFDQVRFLADYERKVPNAFPIRDEEVVFRPAGDRAFRAVVADNRFPGIYRVAVSIGGTVARRGGDPQPFARILEAEVALGILPDSGRSRPTLYWIAPNAFAVTVTPTDRLGNVSAPGTALAPVVSIDGREIAGRSENPFTGEHRVTVVLGGDQIRPAANGQSIQEGRAVVDTLDGEPLVIPGGHELDVRVRVSGTELPVQLPRVIGDERNRSAFDAGSPQAMRIAMASRVPFRTLAQARKAGFEIVRGERPGRDTSQRKGRS